jgi:MFS family permease
MNEIARLGLRRRHVAAVVVGNALEFYDFLTYAYFAVYIGRAFFPASTPTASLLLTLATFGAGFITRPIGGVVLGALGDRVGRRPAMFLSFTLMGIGIVGVALMPSYARIGVAAPILVLGFRLLQGFALGGEVGPSTAFLVEAAPQGRRGLYGSLQSASQFASSFFAGVVGSTLVAVLSPDALASWGWRLAFLLGAAVVPFGLFVRRSLPETVPTQAPAPAAGDVARPSSSLLRVTVAGLMILASATISTYTLLFIATYATTTLHMTARETFACTLIVGICGTLCGVFGGWLSDRVGRKPVIVAVTLVLIAITIPAFHVLDAWRTAGVLYAVVALIAIVFTTGNGISILLITETLPARLRATGTSTIYAVAIAVFGGTTQYNVAWLTAHTGNAVMPAYYMTAALAVGLVGMVSMRESAPAKAAS